MKQKPCDYCGMLFAEHRNKRFCNPLCRNRYRYYKSRDEINFEKRLAAAREKAEGPTIDRMLRQRLDYLLECERLKLKPAPLKSEIRI